jgi:hypothetical protein
MLKCGHLGCIDLGRQDAGTTIAAIPTGQRKHLAIADFIY